MSHRLRRSEVPVEETWDLSDIYTTPDAWAADAARLDGDMDALAAYRGRLAEGATVLLHCLQAQDTLLGRLDRVNMYTYFNASVDGASAENQAMAAGAATLSAQVRKAGSFLVSELSALPEGAIERYRRDEPGLAHYRPLLDEVIARRSHMLSPETETTLAALGETVNMPEAIWRVATAVDMACPPARDAGGEACHPVPDEQPLQISLDDAHDVGLRVRSSSRRPTIVNPLKQVK